MGSAANHLVEKIKALTPQQVASVDEFVDFLLTRSSLSASLVSAPVEEEDLTPETAAALDHARASLAAGDSVSHEEVLREFRS